MLLKVLMLTRQIHLKSMLLVPIGIFSYKGSRCQPTVSNGCHDVSMLIFDINCITILKIHGVDCRCIILSSLN